MKGKTMLLFVSILLAGSTLFAGVCAAQGFYEDGTYSVSSPQAVVSADMNGDGYMDLVSCNGAKTYPGGMSIRLSDGSGGFLAEVMYDVGPGPSAVTVGDFDGDGDLDVATANRDMSIGYNKDVSVLINNGSGQFGAATHYDIGMFANSIVACDYDLDGYADLVVADIQTDQVVFMYSLGGTFQPSGPMTVGDGPSDIAFADVSGNGYPEFIISNLNSNDVTVVYQLIIGGNPMNLFDIYGTYAVSGDPDAVVAADFNGDGYVDIATANSSDETVSVLLGSATTFTFSAEYPVGIGQKELAAADLDDDGNPDLVCTNYYSDHMSVFYGLGDGLFMFEMAVPSSTKLTGVTAADFDGDGEIDLACADSDDTQIAIFRQYLCGDANGSGAVEVGDMVYLINYIFKSGPAPEPLEAGDANGDCAVNVGDAVYIRNYIFVIGSPAPVPYCSNPPAKMAPLDGEFTVGDDGVVSVAAGVPLACLVIELAKAESEPVSLVEGVEVIVADGSTRLGILDLDGDRAVASGVTRVLQLSADVGVTSAIGYTADGQVVALHPTNSSLPNDFELYDAYPNPFNPSTSIRFSMPSADYATLTVYNAIGQRVAVLVDGFVNAGLQVVEWDGLTESGQPASSGVYFYRLEAGKNVESKKMILMK
ncbi:MAG: VCBS repeat-containing protein [candidate division Zixibacteria bacterium]|nr:VCBS repeat-containing protein [candidate division Zixibacteria bacterium]